MDKSIEKIFVDIIKTELSLPDYYDNQYPSIVIGYNNFELGNTDELQCVISNMDTKLISNKNELNAETLKETQSIITQESIQIDLLSANTDARTRRWEIPAALQSYYAQERQSEYQFRIFRIPSFFTNTSFAEGASNLNRFTITILVHVWYEKIKSFTDIYDTFESRVDDEDSIGEAEGIIDFTIE